MCKENFKVRCSARPMDPVAQYKPVKLICFDFDETLTLATFMPSDKDCAQTIGWTPQATEHSKRCDESESILTYNFESPFLNGSRLEKLRDMLSALINGKQRTLAILTRNEHGVVAVLNLLKLAKLDEYFSAIWSMPCRDNMANGAFQVDGKWECFEPPVASVNDHHADALCHVIKHTEAWFPQLAHGEIPSLTGLGPESVVLVDDERANFRDSESHSRVMRYCKVARYDESYRDCGLLTQMGGIGAHSEEDFDTLRAFVDQPWEFPYEATPGNNGIADPAFKGFAGRQREMEPLEMAKAPRAQAGVHHSNSLPDLTPTSDPVLSVSRSTPQIKF